MKKLMLAAALLLGTAACGAPMNHTHTQHSHDHDHTRAFDTVTNCTHTCIMDRHVCSMFTYSMTQFFNHVEEIETEPTEEEQAIMDFVHEVGEQNDVPNPEVIDMLATIIPSIGLVPVSDGCAVRYALCANSCQ